MEATGLKQERQAARPKYQRTQRFRVYCSAGLPGMVQTEAYTATILSALRRRRDLPDDIDDAVTVRMERQRSVRQATPSPSCLNNPCSTLASAAPRFGRANSGT